MDSTRTNLGGWKKIAKAEGCPKMNGGAALYDEA